MFGTLLSKAIMALLHLTETAGLPPATSPRRSKHRSRRETINPRKEAARKLHVQNCKRQQEAGMEWAYMRKAHRLARLGGKFEKQELAKLMEAGGFK